MFNSLPLSASGEVVGGERGVGVVPTLTPPRLRGGDQRLGGVKTEIATNARTQGSLASMRRRG